MQKLSKYFTWDSTAFVIVSLIIIIIGNAMFLLVWLVLSAWFLFAKGPKYTHGNTAPSLMLVWGLWIASIIFWLMYWMLMSYVLVSMSIFYSAYFVDYSKDENYPTFFGLLFMFVIPLIWVIIL